MGRSRPPIENISASVVCRSRPPAMRCSVSILEKSPVHFGRNSENSDLAVSINNYLSKADAQDLIASGRDVPEGDTGGLKVRENFRPTTVIRGVVHERLWTQPAV
jgi:hypothetical protein